MGYTDNHSITLSDVDDEATRREMIDEPVGEEEGDDNRRSKQVETGLESDGRGE